MPSDYLQHAKRIGKHQKTKDQRYLKLKQITRPSHQLELKENKSIAPHQLSPLAAAPDFSWALADINLRGHPITLILFLTALFSALPIVRGASQNITRKDNLASLPSLTTGSAPERTLEAVVKVSSTQTNIGFFQFSKKIKIKQIQEAKIIAKAKEKSLDRLIEQTIELNSNSIHLKSPTAFKIPSEKANQLLKNALSTAIAASGASLALQSLQATGQKLKIDFMTKQDQMRIESITGPTFKITYFPHPLSAGQIFLSHDCVQDKTELTYYLANGLAHFRASAIYSAIAK